MKLTRYNNLESQYPTTFSSMLDKFFNDSIGQNVRQFTPAVDISEDQDKYDIQVSVPGMKKEDFKLELLDGKLTISGERKMEEKNFHSVETHYGSFSRSFYLPEDVDQQNISAKYEDGLLKVALQKSEKNISKATIEVK